MASYLERPGSDDMELKWLEDFVCLAGTLSFSKSAEERHISQSAFSRRIKQLEAWLGVTLVNRATFPAELTKEGKRFLPVAHEAVRGFYATRNDLQPVGRQEANEVTFSALHTLVVTFLPGWLNGLRSRLGDFRSRVSPDKGGIEENIGMLVDGEVDFLLTYAHPSVPFLLDTNSFPHIILGTERVIPVSTAENGESTLDRSIRDGTPLDYLSYGDFSFFGVALSKLFAARPTFSRRTLYENTISMGLKSMSTAGWGTAWLPESLVKDELEKGSLCRASQDPSWNLNVEIRIYRHARPNRHFANAFWQAISKSPG